MTQTDKMLSRKEGGVGYADLQQSGAAQRGVARHVGGGASEFSTTSPPTRAVRVVVLTGAGGKAFVSGADISKFESERSSEEAIDRYNAAVDKANTAVYEFPKPTIAMIRGYCIGGGVGLALCCDLRICSDNSKFGVPAAKLGLGYGYQGHASSWSTSSGRPSPRKSSSPRASSTAAEALAMGLVNRVRAGRRTRETTSRTMPRRSPATRR